MLYGLGVIPRDVPNRGPVASGEEDAGRAAEAHGSHEHPAVAPSDVAAMEAALSTPAALTAGRATFEKTCAPCHEKDGGGSIGPNLTDDFWMHGNTYRGMLTVVKNGILDKGMPRWSTVLTPEQIAQVTAFAATLHGTTPANPKAPQGEKLGAPVTEPEAAGDSTN
jgi:cytochrome c oxidase cbb3-type subunit 3